MRNINLDKIKYVFLFLSIIGLFLFDPIKAFHAFIKNFIPFISFISLAISLIGACILSIYCSYEFFLNKDIKSLFVLVFLFELCLIVNFPRFKFLASQDLSLFSLLIIIFFFSGAIAAHYEEKLKIKELLDVEDEEILIRSLKRK